jgi:RNA polymerase sigma factor (sigma-70 family)
MPETTDDRSLLRSFVLTKDEGAFAELVRRHQGMMQTVAHRVCGDPDDAKDAMQRALVAFARRAGEIRAEPSVGPWLHRAATLEALAVRRQRLKRSVSEREAMEHQQLQTGSMPPEIAAELDEAINRLSPKDRLAVVLHFLENHTFRSIAQKHGGTEAAWQKRGVRALEKLSGMLRRRGVVATGTALGAWLAASPAEAAVPASAIKLMLNEALRQPLAAGASTQTSAALLLIMKLKTTLALCFVIGAALSYGLSERSARSVLHSQQEITRSALPSRTDRSLGAEPAFNLERIASAISQYDSQDQADPSAESRLRALMFSVPEEYLDSVHRLFEEIENTDRFDEIAACFFARWAEINPEAAWLAALSEETYLQAARRGVMLTWLNMDQEAAVAAMMKNRSDDEDLLILHEFAMMKVQHDPTASAHLVDRLAEIWPRADRRLFEDVARTWAYNDPGPAGEWVGSYWNRDLRNEFLKRFAWRVGHNDYRDGLEMANRIDDPALRQRARCSALIWFRGGWHAIQPDVGDPELDISSGFPDDWNQLEVSAFSEGIMRGTDIQRYDRLLDIAKTEQQRQAVHQGTIEGAVYFKPWIATRAVESVNPAYATTETGRNTLGAFILRWTEHDAKAASEWLEVQPNDAKTAVMRDTLRTNNPK